MTQNPDVKHLSTPPVNPGDIIAEQQADTANNVVLAVSGFILFKNAILSQIPFFGDRFSSPAELQAHVNALQAQYAKEIEKGLKGHAANDNDEYEAAQKKAA